MGRWAPHKGVKRLAQFIGTRLEATSDDTVTIAGCGRIPEGPIARHLIASNRVRIIPHYRREELRSLLESHDVGLFTSDVEGWGLSLNEMVEAGLPVFATNTGGVPDMKAACDGCILPFPPPPSIDVNACRAQMMKRDPPGGRTGWDDVADLYEALITTHRTRGNGR
jgi:glycosyltransferase involved in cell wall biosynthesis